MLSRNRSKRSNGDETCVASIKESGSVPLALAVVVYPICLGQEYHEGEMLEATFFSLRKCQKMAVVISGALYRHTLPLTEALEQTEAYEQAIQRGEDWEDRYKSLINETTIPITVYTWEYWLDHEKYSPFRKQLEDFYRDKSEFKELFDSEANLFIDRLLKKKCTIEDKTVAFNRCLEYLKEECTVFALMQKIDPYTHFVYPGQAKAIAITFQSFGLRIAVVRPTFEYASIRLVNRIDSPFNREDRVQRIRDLAVKAKSFADVSDVFSNCKLYFLKRATQYIRDKATVQIAKRVMQEGSNLTLCEKSDINSKLLIFSSKEYADKFDGESWKKYIPSKKLDFRALASLPESSFPTNGVIDLRPLENEELKKCEFIMQFIETTRDKNLMMVRTELKSVCEIIEFSYSYLVFSVGAPEAKFYIIGDDEMPCKLYYSYKDSTIKNKDDALRQITNYLLKIPTIGSAFSGSLEETKMEGAAESRPVVHILDPIMLVKPIFEFFKSVKQSQNLGSAPPTPNGSASSTPFELSPVPSMLTKNFSEMSSLNLERANSLEKKAVSDGTFVPTSLFFTTVNNRILSNNQKSENPSVQTGLFFTLNRGSAIKLLAPATIIGVVGLALRAQYC